MFTVEELEQDIDLVKYLSSKLTNGIYHLDTFKEIGTLNELYNSLASSEFELVKHLPKYNLYLYRVEGLGIGYRKHYTIPDIKLLLNKGNLPKDSKVKFKYDHGNIFARTIVPSIYLQKVLTDEVYVLVNSCNSIWSLFIGKPYIPNLHWFNKDLDNKQCLLSDIDKIDGIRCIWLEEERLDVGCIV